MADFTGKFLSGLTTDMAGKALLDAAYYADHVKTDPIGIPPDGRVVARFAGSMPIEELLQTDQPPALAPSHRDPIRPFNREIGNGIIATLRSSLSDNLTDIELAIDHVFALDDIERTGQTIGLQVDQQQELQSGRWRSAVLLELLHGIDWLTLFKDQPAAKVLWQRLIERESFAKMSRVWKHRSTEQATPYNRFVYESAVQTLERELLTPQHKLITNKHTSLAIKDPKLLNALPPLLMLATVELGILDVFGIASRLFAMNLPEVKTHPWDVLTRDFILEAADTLPKLIKEATRLIKERGKKQYPFVLHSTLHLVQNDQKQRFEEALDILLSAGYALTQR